MKVLYTLFLIISTVSTATISLADLCQKNGKSVHTMYGGEQVYQLRGKSNNAIDCAVSFQNPATSIGGTFNLSITFESEYNIGINLTTRKAHSAADKGVKVGAGGNSFVGSKTAFFKGLNDSTSQVGTPLNLGPHEVFRSTPTTGVMFTLQYKGELPGDQLVMKVNLTCTPGPCPTPPATTPAPSTVSRSIPTSPSVAAASATSTANITASAAVTTVSAAMSSPVTEPRLATTNSAASYSPSVLNLLLSPFLAVMLAAC